MRLPIRPVILAGGAGTRLWPLSTPLRPKQLLQLVGEGNLLEQTIARVSDRQCFGEPLIVCGADQANAIAAVAPGARLLVEPCARNSAPAIALAAACEAPETLLLVLPSDHHISDPAPLLQAVQQARGAAEDGRIVTFGIRPTRPETGYGYISPGKRLSEAVFEAARFTEKPVRAAAEALIGEGSYWNAGIFLMKAGTVLEELEAHAPEVARSVRAALDGSDLAAHRIDPGRSQFDSCPGISFDYAVMERSGRVAVIAVDLNWSDLGSWAAVYDLSPKDTAANVVDEHSTALGSRGCLLRSVGPRVVAIGVDDLVVVATPTHVLVVPRADAQRVREAAQLAGEQPGPSEPRGAPPEG